MACVVALLSQAVMADEGGVSFWIPGTFGSLAAVPQQPGWSLATINYHDNVSGGADVALARLFEIGKVPVNFSGSVSGGIKLPNFDIQVFVPSYVFATPVLGGQAAVQMLGFRPSARAPCDVANAEMKRAAESRLAGNSTPTAERDTA